MSMLFKRIKDWATSITAFRTGDVLPVDGPSGTAKMSKDDLLRVTERNAADISGAFVSLEFTAGSNISLGSYSFGDVVDLTPEAVANYKYAVGEVSEGDIVFIFCRGGAGPRAYAFLDADNKLILMGLQNERVERLFVAPPGAAKVVVNSAMRNVSNPVENPTCSIRKYQSAALRDVFGLVDLSPVYKNHTVNVTSTTIGDFCPLEPNTSSGWASGIYPVHEGDRLKISAKGGVGSRAYYFLDAQRRYLLISPQNLQIENADVPVPAGAAWLVVNSNESVVPLKVVCDATRWCHVSDLETFEDNLGRFPNFKFIAGGNISLGSYSIGDVVDLTPDTSSGASLFEYVIASVSPGDHVQLINCNGGRSPRAYAFLDADDKLLEMSAEIARISESVIVAPSSAAKIVINNNVRQYGAATAYVDNSAWSKKIASFTSVDTINPVINDKLKAIVNGANCDGTATPVILNDTTTEKACHVASFVNKSDKIYYAYYCNYIAAREQVTEQTARFGIYDKTLQTKSIVDVMGVGDTFGDYSVTKLSDIVVLEDQDNPDKLHLLWTCALNDGSSEVWSVLHAPYTISTNTIGTAEICTLSGGGFTGNFDYNGLVGLFAEVGLPEGVSVPNNTIQVMPKVTYRVENSQKVYYTGIGCFELCFAAKTTDFVNWEFVAIPSFKYSAQYEPATYLVGNKLMWFCRQIASKNFGALSYYDLTTNKWADPVYVQDCQSRPDWFNNKGTLYLVHAPIDRNHIAFESVPNTSAIQKMFGYFSFYLESVFYPFVQVDSPDNIYMVATHSRRQIYLYNLNLTQVSESTIYSKIKSIISE